MGAIFDFTSREKSEKIMRESWEEFRNALARGEFSYDETDKAMATTFLHVFDNMFQYDGVKKLLTKRFKDIRTGEFDLGRGTRLRPEEMTASYDRIMPCSRFITNDNRFSPLGVEWLYLSLGDKNEDGSSNSKEIAQKECRMHSGEKFAFCQFELPSVYDDLLIVDLTSGSDLTFEQLNHGLENYGRYHLERSVAEFFLAGITPNQGLHAEQFRRIVTEWLVLQYAKMLSKNIFVPVDGRDKSYMYAPFQTIAKYFLNQGYHGIIYKSTVCEGGRNLVLFDKNHAMPYGDVMIEIVG